jgi:uncharacterized membrane protein YidH (DUF202 family)
VNEFDPDVIGSLALERNVLAWQRTAMSWAAAGCTVTRYFSRGGLFAIRTSIGYLMLAVGAMIWVDGIRRYHRQAAIIRSAQPITAAAFAVRSVGYATTLVVAAIIVIELRHW